MSELDGAEGVWQCQAIYDEFGASVDNGKALVDEALPLAYR